MDEQEKSELERIFVRFDGNPDYRFIAAQSNHMTGAQLKRYGVSEILGYKHWLELILVLDVSPESVGSGKEELIKEGEKYLKELPGIRNLIENQGQENLWYMAM